MIAMEKWDDAHFRELDAHTKANKDGLRQVNYDI
jgi:hypothetical protein